MAADTPMEDVNGMAAEEDQRGFDATERTEGIAEGATPPELDNAEDQQLEDAGDTSDRENDANGAPVVFNGRTSDDDARDLEEKEKDWDAESDDERPEDDLVEDDDLVNDLADELAGDLADDLAGDVAGDMGPEISREGVADKQDVNRQDTEEGEDAEPVGVVREEGLGDGANAGGGSEAGPRMVTFPLARVKRIIKLDPDIKQVSSEALKTIGLAAELFLESLAVSTAHVTRAGKRSTLKIEDLLQTVKTRRRYKECLGGDLEYLRTVDENQAAKQAARQSKKQEAARQLPPGVKPITSFFKQ